MLYFSVLQYQNIPYFQSEITWTLALLAGACLLFLLWTRMSRRHFIEAMVVALYGYEVIISYKV